MKNDIGLAHRNKKLFPKEIQLIRIEDDEIALTMLRRNISKKPSIYKAKSETESSQYYFSYYFPKQYLIFKLEMDKRTSALRAFSEKYIEQEDNQHTEQEKSERRNAVKLVAR